MPEQLKKRPFRPQQDISVAAVRNFDCGSEPWELEVSDWIKGRQGGVLDDMQRPGGCEVWLYRTQANVFVGFGSLSEPAWGYPNKHDPRPNLIPMVGIASKFRGQPSDGPKEDRFAWQIMDDLVTEARQHSERSPALVLYVHHQNLRAIAFYTSYGFAPYTRTYRDPSSGVVYQTMRLHL